MKAVDNNNDDDDDDDEQQSEEMQPVPEDVSLSDSTAVGQGGSQQPTETAVIFTTRASNLVNPDSEIYVEPPPVAGYVLAYMPVDSIVDPVAEPCPGLRTLGLLTKRRNATKSLVALLQLCFSVFVLARARGDQVALYGVAAFSLSVAPYAVMAAVNLLANAFVPQYDCLFLVENDVMQEMRSQHGFQFDGVAGKLRQTEKGEAVTLHPPGEADEGLKSSGFLGFPDSSKTRGCGCLLRTKPYRTASYQMYASQSVQPKRLSAWVAGGTSTSKLQGTLQSGNAYVAFLCCDSTSNKE
ncbi:hypothetical protein J3458_004889 [Metarhizium acridum]|uniref:uncharacterized protein n=1 Tax=Metarhizium acridum TaxID=92637 RepID=UPI001C6D013D|nr:hypothetical protein J3458_004863 [Metarhizium acridum]KAG8417380.1 hypothetical protein J3458_004889 [Metarhizium acridum]